MTGQADDTTDGVRIDVRRGSPTDHELAALLAVVSEAYSSEAAEAVAPEDTVRSSWSLTQRNLRQPLRRDVGWGRFSG
ncbi:acyl-CoA carboxylase subunit epsilon [Microbacterium sp. CFBP9034]|uniref:acyl-CoA carboxylase subunit epsilon n=1 Tax=Microbacterium sp. CFBP9034 TaxID=3096540 RepID=UPI002A6B6FBA|nr:acyl-CoA carboxylase subunit epsilon [Microbacterium sp. CFBP9034]MDY0908973.1 acyl-CoA carboxylase subunit epsilon [Microbacterium sp. CFBP9034]